MKKSQADPTTARNLDDKFDQSEDVLDYFDVRKARVIDPQAKELGSKSKVCLSGEAEATLDSTIASDHSALLDADWKTSRARENMMVSVGCRQQFVWISYSTRSHGRNRIS